MDVFVNGACILFKRLDCSHAVCKFRFSTVSSMWLTPCLLNSLPRMYADDTHLTFAAKTVSNIDSNLNEDLSRVNNWLTANKLTLNTSKTEFIMIGSRQRLNTFDTPPSLEIDGAPVS